MKRKHLKNFILAGSGAYLMCATYASAKLWIDELKRNIKCSGTALGMERMKKGDVRTFKLYSDEEQALKPALSSVELTYFPNDSGEKKDFVIIVPGGAFVGCALESVANPVAAKVNQCGYPAFVLKYRVGRHSDDYAPLDDLARALEFIKANADKFNIKLEKYLLAGFSAGGSVASLFATKSLGFERYTLPGPCCMMLAYPWTNIVAGVEADWNLVKAAFLFAGKLHGIKFMLGKLLDDRRNTLCVHDSVDKDYPPCYIIHGEKDFLVPFKQNSRLLHEALRRNNVPEHLRICSELTHGFGVGIGTEAEGWIEECINFWEDQREK